MSESFAKARALVERGEKLLQKLRYSSTASVSPELRVEVSMEIANWLLEFGELVDNPAYQVDGDPKAISDVPRAVSNRLWELESVLTTE